MSHAKGSLFFTLLLFIFGCAGSQKTIGHLDNPKTDHQMIIGNIIIENINQEFAFDNWDMGVDLVFLGKLKNDSIKTFRVTTDYHGYYCIPNVPEGQYVLKAIELPLTGGLPVIIVNDCQTAQSKFYRMKHPERGIEFTASWFPANRESKIINYKILWFGLRTAQISDINQNAIGEVIVIQSSDPLENHRFYDNGYRYTRPDPLLLFKSRFPESNWWKMKI